MPRGRISHLIVTLSPADRALLQGWQRSTTLPVTLARRGRIVLLRADGLPITAIAARVGIARRSVYTYLRCWQAAGVDGLWPVRKHGDKYTEKDTK